MERIVNRFIDPKEGWMPSINSPACRVTSELRLLWIGQTMKTMMTKRYYVTFIGTICPPHLSLSSTNCNAEAVDFTTLHAQAHSYNPLIRNSSSTD